MNMIKSVRHIQLNKISYTPNLFKAVIIFEPYNNKYDESDEIEHNKQTKLLNKSIIINGYNSSTSQTIRKRNK